MARLKKAPNDQTELIMDLREKNIDKVWEKVKYIGFKDIPDITLRYLIFKKAAASFDPYKNNNFIMFFKAYIKYAKMNNEEREHYKFTSNSAIISHIKNNACSPQENLPILIEELLEFIG